MYVFENIVFKQRVARREHHDRRYLEVPKRILANQSTSCRNEKDAKAFSGSGNRVFGLGSAVELIVNQIGSGFAFDKDATEKRGIDGIILDGGTCSLSDVNADITILEHVANDLDFVAFGLDANSREKTESRFPLLLSVAATTQNQILTTIQIGVDGTNSVSGLVEVILVNAGHGLAGQGHGLSMSIKCQSVKVTAV